MTETPLLGTPTFAIHTAKRAPLPQGHLPETIDSTMLSAFRTCPQKFYLNYVLKRVGKGKSIHLHAGGAFAKGIETVRLAYFRDGLSRQEAVMKGLLELWRTYGNVPEFDDQAKNWANMSKALVQYFEVYPLHSDAIQPVIFEGRPGVEFTFAVPLDLNHPETGNPFTIAGKFDLLGIYTGAIFCVDEKTAGDIKSNFVSQWDMRGQFLCYNWGAHQYGYKTAGTIVRGVGILKTKIKFAEAIVYYAPWEIERWYEQTLYDIQRMVEMWKENYWPLNLAESCTSFNGCAMVKTCKSANPQHVLDSDTQENTWDPLAR